MHVPPIPHLTATDPTLADLIERESRRQHDVLRMIPSENYVSAAVLEATGTVLTNKYSEGYAGKRYYEGQQLIDPIERLASQRAQDLFGVDHANVQPYSGSPANLAIYLAYMTPGDTFLSLELAHGGHLTHGSPVSATGKWFRPVHYGVDPQTGRIDLDQVRDLALRERPKMIFCGGTAIPRIIDFPAFAAMAAEVDAILVADIAHIAGLIAGGAHPSPVGYAPIISTTTHKTLRGPRGAMLLSDAAHATALDKAVFPGLQGGPHNHTTAGIAVALHEAAQPAFATYAQQIVANAKALAAGADRAGLRPGLRRDRQPPDPGRPGQQADQRQAGGQGAGPGRHRVELQHRAVRPAQAVGPRPASGWVPRRSPPAASPRSTCRRSPPGWTRPSRPASPPTRRPSTRSPARSPTCSPPSPSRATTADPPPTALVRGRGGRQQGGYRGPTGTSEPANRPLDPQDGRSLPSAAPRSPDTGPLHDRAAVSSRGGRPASVRRPVPAAPPAASAGSATLAAQAAVPRGRAARLRCHAQVPDVHLQGTRVGVASRRPPRG